MTTKRAKLRKGNSGTGKTVAKRSDTRAKWKAETARKMTAAAVQLKAVAKPAATAKKAAPKKKAAAKK